VTFAFGLQIVKPIAHHHHHRHSTIIIAVQLQLSTSVQRVSFSFTSFLRSNNMCKEVSILDYVGNVLHITETSATTHSLAIHLQDINKGDPIKQIWEDGAMYYNFVYDFDYIQNCSMCFVPINSQIKDLRYKGHYNNFDIFDSHGLVDKNFCIYI
jgi:hypothetical protein